MTTRFIILFMMCVLSVNLSAQTDSEFYEKPEKEKEVKEVMVSFGAFYGGGRLSLGEVDEEENEKNDDNDEKYDLKMKGVSVAIERSSVLFEGNVGFCDMATAATGKLYFGFNFMPQERFQIRLHFGGGIGFVSLDKEKLNLEKNNSVTACVGAKLRTLYFISTKTAIYAAVDGNYMVPWSKGALVRNNIKYSSSLGQYNIHLGLAFTF